MRAAPATRGESFRSASKQRLGIAGEECALLSALLGGVLARAGLDIELERRARWLKFLLDNNDPLERIRLRG